MSLRPITRRALLAAVPVLALAAACSPAPPPVRLAAGEPGGFYTEFGDLLAAVGRDSGLTMRALTTGGSRSNVEMVADGGADAGLALTDLVLAARGGTAPFARRVEALAIGRVYENYLQLAVRAESPFRTLADLAGRPVSLGAPGSGAALTAGRLVAASGIPVAGRELGLTAATEALDRGVIDGFLWSGGVPTPAVEALAARRPIRLLPLGEHLEALRARYGAGPYTLVAVPAGVYGSSVAVPTVGVANLLVATAALPDSTAGELARLLVTRAPDLVPASALGTQYLDRPALVDTGDVPLHPGAAQAYRELHG